MAPVNNIEQRAAKKLAAAESINYTEALRLIRNSGIKPSDVLAGKKPSDYAEPAALRLTNEQFVQKYSSHGRFAVQTGMGSDVGTTEYFVGSRNLFLCGPAHSGKTDVLKALIEESEAGQQNIVVWDAGGGIARDIDPGSAITTDSLVDFHHELTALLDRGFSGDSVIILDNLGPLLAESGPIADDVISMLIRALREGRQAGISVYVTNDRVLAASDHTLVAHLLSASQFVLMGPVPLVQWHTEDDLQKLPPLLSGWFVTKSGMTMWRAQVPTFN